MSEVDWLDNDTLLLMSAFGGQPHVTRSGNARTVRLWRRGTTVEEAPVLFSVPIDHTAATAQRDWNVGEERILFRDIIGSFKERTYLGNRTGPLQAVDLPKSARLAWHADAMAILLREAWTVEGRLMLLTRYSASGCRTCSGVFRARRYSGVAASDRR